MLANHKRITIVAMSSSDDRSERLQVRCSAAEIGMVEELAKAQGLSRADVVRQLIRREFSEHTAAVSQALALVKARHTTPQLEAKKA